MTVSLWINWKRTERQSNRNTSFLISESFFFLFFGSSFFFGRLEIIPNSGEQASELRAMYFGPRQKKSFFKFNIFFFFVFRLGYNQTIKFKNINIKVYIIQLHMLTLARIPSVMLLYVISKVFRCCHIYKRSLTLFLNAEQKQKIEGKKKK